MAKLPPQPLGVAPGSSYWNDWYEKLRSFVETITTSVDWSIITGKPNTLAGYGITDITGMSNPSAQIGLTAVNGAATTAMRSDAAPALNVGITPTWSGAHIWTSTGSFGSATVPSGVKISISDNASTASSVSTFSSAAATTSPSQQLIRWRGSIGGASAVATGDRLGSVIWAGATSATTVANTAAILAQATDNYSAAASGSKLEFYNTTIGATTRTLKAAVESDGTFTNLNKMFPGTDAAAFQTVCGLYAGTGAPNNANGNNGDIYFNAAGGALTTIYQRRAGAWVGIV